uniref:Putative ovule protein n=1 Tax=Solanum chacoense TaxID=4108 RepID=A0A0V0GEM9_SOLCH
MKIEWSSLTGVRCDAHTHLDPFLSSSLQLRWSSPISPTTRLCGFGSDLDGEDTNLRVIVD